MRTVEMDDVKDLSGVLEEAAKGEPFLLTQNGKPIVQITSVVGDKPKLPRRIGMLEGLYTVPDDFDTMADAEFAEMIAIIEEKQF